MNKLAKLNPQPRMIGEVGKLDWIYFTLEYWKMMAEEIKPTKFKLEQDNVKILTSIAEELSK